MSRFEILLIRFFNKNDYIEDKDENSIDIS